MSSGEGLKRRGGLISYKEVVAKNSASVDFKVLLCLFSLGNIRMLVLPKEKRHKRTLKSTEAWFRKSSN